MIPENERLLTLLASANRDEAQFPRADEFIVDREPNRHLSFGMGIHFCIGAPLARLEGDVALRTLLPRISGLRIAGEIEPGIFLRPGGPTSLMVEFEQKPLAVTA